MVSFSNEELANAPNVKIGQEIDCPHCGGKHTLVGGIDEDGKETTALLFYKCGDDHHLAGVDSKRVTFSKYATFSSGWCKGGQE